MQASTNTKPQQNDLKTYEVFIGPKTKVTIDPKSKTQVVNFPFEFPDNEKGVIIICKLSDDTWVPSADLSHVAIIFK